MALLRYFRPVVYKTQKPALQHVVRAFSLLLLQSEFRASCYQLTTLRFISVNVHCSTV